jgi:hypothetical protein
MPQFDPKRWVAVIPARDEWLTCFTPDVMATIAGDHGISSNLVPDLRDTLSEVGAAYIRLKHNAVVDRHAPARDELREFAKAARKTADLLAKLSDKARHQLERAADLGPAHDDLHGLRSTMPDGTATPLGRPRVNSADRVFADLVTWAERAAETANRGGRPGNDALIYFCFEMTAWWHNRLGRSMQIGKLPKNRQLLGFLCDAAQIIDGTDPATVRVAARNANDWVIVNLR